MESGMTRIDPLAEYNRKRDFGKTSEPSGKRAKNARGSATGGATGNVTGNRFIVQKHDASRLHWDLRLEADGVLKSWAVTKGPSADPAIKRLAVRTEDHPLAYAEFEGTIPQREYGGGTVMLWDRGTWEPVAGKSRSDIDQGHLHFSLHGERMKGEWLLIRLKPRGKEKRENWLLRKLDDEFASRGDKLVQRELTSVLSGRTMREIAAGQGQRQVGQPQPQGCKPAGPATPAILPKFRKPQLATLVDSVPAGNVWMHEIKFDGYRALVAAAGDTVIIYTRSGKDWTGKFAPLAQKFAALNLPPCLIDGEIVALDKDGNPDFSKLQKVLKRGQGRQNADDALSFHAFDLLELNGEDFASLGNIERKERLEALLSKAQPPIHVTDHIIGAGEQLYRTMCDAGQEGIISKRIDARYSSTRGRAWVKVKCTLRQEFVIIGWKKSTARARPFASLLLAQNEAGKLVYKGNVGTGFSHEMLDELAAKMAPLARKTPPADVAAPARRGVTWVSPKLVAEVAFSEFTADGNVRHGSFLGLRADKPASEITPEAPIGAPVMPGAIVISSRDRVMFPDSGQTKGALADYYAAIAPIMLPFASQRPLSLVRCPQGRSKKCFFQKHHAGSLGDAVHRVAITEKSGATEDYLYIEDARGIVQCVQMGTIEFHGWGSRCADTERPDRMIFDLDPDEGLDFAAVKLAARDIHDQLDDIGLANFAMLSGGKGVHIVVPLSGGHSWEQHKDFARRFAEALSLAEPERFTASMSKAKRKDKIFIDWLRNQRGATASLPYSARARSGAPVAVPVTWAELKAIENAHSFSIDHAGTLLDRAQSSHLSGWGFAEQKLPDL